MTKRRRGSRRIPEFMNRDEEAAWWDTHDLSDYWDEFSPVNIEVSPRILSKKSMSVRLPEATLRELAHLKGVGHTTLARMWIIERLSAEKTRKAS